MNKRLYDLKVRHNALHDKGYQLYERIEALAKEVLDLREQIETIEGDDYDPIPLLFGSGFELPEGEIDWLAEAERDGRRDAGRGQYRPPYVLPDEDPENEAVNDAYDRGFIARRDELGETFKWA